MVGVLSQKNGGNQNDSRNAEESKSRRFKFDIKRAETENQQNPGNACDKSGDFFSPGGFNLVAAFNAEHLFKSGFGFGSSFGKLQGDSFFVGHGQKFPRIDENFGRSPKSLVLLAPLFVFGCFDGDGGIFALQFVNRQIRRDHCHGKQFRVAVLLGEVSEFGAKGRLDLFTDDLRSAVAVLHNRGAIADGRSRQHIEFLAG